MTAQFIIFDGKSCSVIMTFITQKEKFQQQTARVAQKSAVAFVFGYFKYKLP